MSALHRATVVDRRRVALHDELIRWAHAYATNGLPIFPVAWNKFPHIKWGAGASTDPAQIDIYWRRWPCAMIGLPTGAKSGLIVVDIDRKNGVDGFQTMRANGWTIDARAVEVRTPSGGSHFYFPLKQGDIIKNSASKLGPGIDVRGDGGFVVLPPSRPSLDAPDYHFAEGQEYREMGRLLW
ncbi:MAG TPA: bifunctional DNA primase/polymerase [Beijerinckiaceae bacterium]|nr:bifunctional DNA primase/polymerase [Beijerinckiaceae bacterium]